MKVIAHGAKKDACRLYRISLPIEALNNNDVSEEYDRHYQTVVQDTISGQTLIDVLDPPDADVIVFQRVLRRTTYELMRVLQQKHDKAVVLEIDDDFHAVPPFHPTRDIVDPIKSPDINREWLMRAAQIADLVTVSTPALAQRYGAHGRVVVLPNYVPRSYLDLQQQHHKGIWVGWSGSTVTHVGDLNVTKGGVATAIEDCNAELHIIGQADGIADGLGTTKRFRTTGWVGLDKYPRALAQLDIAIAPLKNNTFNKSKSWLKPVEAAAVGVPTVMSPVDEYVRLHKDYGLGIIAENANDWYSLIARLIKEPALRDEMAASGREVVREHLTIEDNAWKWEEAWALALENRRQRRVA